MCCWETRCKQACNPETLSGHLSCSFVHQDQQCGFPLKKKDWVQRKHRVCNESGVCAPSRVQTDCCNLRLGQPTQKPSSHPPRFLLPARGIFMNWRTLFGLHCKLQFKIRSLQFCALTSGGPPPTTHPPTHPERFLVQFSRADAVLLTGSSSIEKLFSSDSAIIKRVSMLQSVFRCAEVCTVHLHIGFAVWELGHSDLVQPTTNWAAFLCNSLPSGSWCIEEEKLFSLGVHFKRTFMVSFSLVL